MIAADMVRRLQAYALWFASAVWPFWGPLFGDRVLYFRDITYTYYPDLVFLSRALSVRVWPLWNPAVDAGSPFLASYPVHILLVLAFGARWTLALSPPLHLLVAMAGSGALHRALGGRWEGAAVAGAVVGLSGLMLGSVLYPIFLSVAWVPLAVALLVRLVRAPSYRDAAWLAMVLALEVSAQGIEALPQTALAAAILVPWAGGRRAVVPGLASVAVSALLAAPALLGGLWLLHGTARGAGLPVREILSYSVALPVLLEGVLPRFFGDPHTFTEIGFWGQPFFHGGTPFFLSLYLGPVVLLLAVQAGIRERRLWALLAIGLLLGLGSHGPLEPLLVGVARLLPLRVPAKFLFLSLLAVSLLAGRGLERAMGRPAGRVLVLTPSLLVIGLAFAAWQSPDALCAGLSTIVPGAAEPLARRVVATRWPGELAVTGLLTLGAGLALARGGRVAALAGLLAVLDLLRVNGDLSPSTGAGFYDLRPQVRAAVDWTRPAGRYRWFSYGVANSPPLHWNPALGRINSDVWLYHLDRQSLLPRTQVLDGLDGAYDVDRMGLAPGGSTFSRSEISPRSFRRQYARLRQANVRWVVSFVELPRDLAIPRRQLRFPEAAEPMWLFELRDALPRAYFVRTLDGPPEPAVRVEYQLLDPHTVEVRADTPSGFLVVLDGFHGDWRAEEGARPASMLRVYGRYRAIPTAGGRRVFTLRFRPPWRAPALFAAAAGLAAAILMLVCGGPRRAELAERPAGHVLD